MRMRIEIITSVYNYTLNAINPHSVNQKYQSKSGLNNHHIRKLGVCAFNLVKTL